MGTYVLEVPKWDGQNYFTKEIILFLVMTAALFIGIMLCFWGYKYFRGLCAALFGCLAAYGAMYLAEALAENPVLKLWIFMSATFFGSSFFYLAGKSLLIFMDRIHGIGVFRKIEFLLSGVLGAALVAGIAEAKIYRCSLINGILFLVLAVIGIFYQNRKRKQYPVFYNYEDILKMQPGEDKKSHA